MGIYIYTNKINTTWSLMMADYIAKRQSFIAYFICFCLCVLWDFRILLLLHVLCKQYGSSDTCVNALFCPTLLLSLQMKKNICEYLMSCSIVNAIFVQMKLSHFREVFCLFSPLVNKIMKHAVWYSQNEW